MSKFLVLPSICNVVAIVCCSISVLLTPHASLPTKFLFLASSVIFSLLRASIWNVCYCISLCLSNIVFIRDQSTGNVQQNEWLSSLIVSNVCAIGMYIVCKEINNWSILNQLSHKSVWKTLPEVSFMNAEDFVAENQIQDEYSNIKRQKKSTDNGLSPFVKTDFKVDMQGGVQGLLQTTVKPVIYNNNLLGYCKIVTQVQLPQSALYDLFSSLDDSEATYKELFGHGLDHSRFLLDPRGNIISWNPGVFTVMGFSREEVLGNHISMFYTIEDRIAGRPLADLAVAKTEAHLEIEAWMKRKDREPFWANVNFTSLHNNEQMLGYTVIMRDFTDKKKSLDSLHETEEKYQMLVSSVRDYTIIMLDINGVITTWNSGAQKINGYHAEEVIGRHFSLFYEEAAIIDKKPEKELELASVEGRFEDEAWRVKKDGTRYYASVVLSAIYNARKDIIGFSKVTRDITERMKTQAALRATEERFQLLISCVKDYSIFMLDPDGVINSWNLGAQRIKGYSAEEAIGKHFSIMYTPEDRANNRPHHALHTAATEGRYEDEGLRVRKDGSTFWANVIITAMRDNSGKLVGFSKVTRDVTERRQTDIALHSAMQSAQAAALAKQSFLAMMSHEIRTPLHAIITLSLLLQSSDLDVTQRDYLETIHNSSKQLLSIINDILDFSKIESGKMDLILKPFNLRQCIEETIDLVLVKPSTGKSNNQIDVVYIMAPGVPENIISDTVRVRQILMNYLSNAVKFTERGEVVVKVTCSPSDNQDNDIVKITFAVHDTGIGIKPTCVEELFQPFYQIIPGSPQVFGGTGLGLVISKKLSQLMGGNVWVESEEGVGSTFFFSINAQVGKPTMLPSPRTPNSLEVLVVDESAAGSEALTLILKQSGCSVHQATDFNGALPIVNSNSKMDVIFVTRRFHARNPDNVASLKAHTIKNNKNNNTSHNNCFLILTGTPDSLEYHGSTVPRGTPNSDMFGVFLPKPFRTDMVRTVLRSVRGGRARGGKGLSINPCSPSTSPTPVSPLMSPLASPSVSPLSNLRILVAEDNAVNRKVAIRVLERLGYLNVEMVVNGKEVLTAMESKVYDVVLMDIQMPVMDGWTATEEIFKIYPPERRPAVIAMTAYAYEHDQQRCAQLGMKAHIAKPVDMVALAEILRSCSA